jgi:hypothetical protein
MSYTKVLVIGGHGFLGAKVLKGLSSITYLEVDVGSPDRNSPDSIYIDLNDASTFSAMEKFDHIINCSNSLNAKPDKAIAYALEQGLTFIEMSADLDTIERLITADRNKTLTEDGPFKGVLIIGAGVFPGISNLLAKELYESTKGCEQLEVVIRFSPLSGAGHGMCDLMSNLLQTNTVRYENGARVEEEPISSGVDVKTGEKKYKSLKAGLPEGIMLFFSTKASTTAAYFAPAPGILRMPILIFSRVLNYLKVIRDPLQSIFVLMCKLFRGNLLKNKATFIEMTAIANRDTYPETLAIKISDGILAGAYIPAVLLEHLHSAEKPKPGMYFIDQILELSETIPMLEDISEGEIRIALPIKSNKPVGGADILSA